MTKLACVFCTTQCSILSSQLIQNASRSGTRRPVHSKVFSETCLTRTLPASVWTSVRESSSLVIAEEESSLLTLRTEPRWRSSRKVTRVLTKTRKIYLHCSITTADSNATFLQQVGMERWGSLTTVLPMKKDPRNTPWANTPMRLPILISSMRINYVQVVVMMVTSTFSTTNHSDKSSTSR